MAGIIEVKDQGKVRIYDADNSNYVDIVVPSTVSSNRTITIPDATFTIPTTDTVYTHPNHSGEVTSTADGATVIADNIVDEANLKVSNSPTNGYMLTAQSGNTGGLTWAAAGGGAWNVISSGTASNSTSIDFTSIATTYDHYALIITDFRPADQSNAHLLIQIKNDNNGSFKTSSYATHASRLSASSDSYDGKGETSTSGVEIANAMEDNASYGCSAVVYFPNLTESGYQKILSQSQYKSNAHKGGTTFGIYTSVTDPVDGIRIKFANQNITSGKATLYGIANT